MIVISLKIQIFYLFSHVCWFVLMIFPVCADDDWVLEQ